jgi:N-acetylglucosaminyldiphosphoundecaprenol N-acetyl-beta-D-mannosaminyltransferase
MSTGQVEGMPAFPAVEVMGVPVSDLRQSELVDLLKVSALSLDGRPVLSFAMHIGGLLEIENPEFLAAMTAADIVYADGVSAQVLARIAGAQRIERAVTTDIGWELLRRLRSDLGRPARVALLGGRPGIADEALSRMAAAGAAEPSFSAHGYQEDWTAVIEDLRRARPEVIFVGLGAPREMLWVRENRDRLPPSLVMTCGGWFGYIVGDEPRAPALMRRLYLEWLYRLSLQPRRLGGRYLRGLLRYPSLVGRVARARLGSSGRSS